MMDLVFLAMIVTAIAIMVLWIVVMVKEK